MTPRVVAIDGAAGSGKSTLARLLARELRLPYVNTGAMYRALTLAAHRREVEVEDGVALVRLMETLDFTLSPPGRSGEPRELWIDGAPPPEALESADVEASVSTVATHPEVRAAMRSAQRALGEGGAVMEGRDIGSAVFPDARAKMFLVAEPQERAGRRVEERGVEDVAGALHERDRRDARVNPLVPVEDAVVIDTSELDVEGTLRAALAIVAERAPELLSGGGRP
ncbi:MAG: (d)CMP kinase [Actinobacteria bacterium]|nr:(d)CMP kinase [Actinomycetota bacterium]